MSNEIQDIMDEQMAVLRTQKPYLINALRQWCHDKDARPHLMVDSTWPGTTGVPANLIHEQLVLNVSAAAAAQFLCDDTGISVSLTFGGVQRKMFLPMAAIRAIYAPELGNVGMSFDSFREERPDAAHAENDPPAETPRERPSFLSVVK